MLISHTFQLTEAPDTGVFYFAKKRSGQAKSAPTVCRKSMCHLAICTKVVRLCGTPGEGSPPKNSPPDCFSPLLRFFEYKNFAVCGLRRGRCPSTPPPFEKGGRKLLTFCYRKTVCQQADGADRLSPLRNFRYKLISFSFRI